MNSFSIAAFLGVCYRTCHQAVVVSRASWRGATEMFFGYEALANVERRRNNGTGFLKALERVEEYFAQLGEEDKTLCEECLLKLRVGKPNSKHVGEI